MKTCWYSYIASCKGFINSNCSYIAMYKYIHNISNNLYAAWRLEFRPLCISKHIDTTLLECRSSLWQVLTNYYHESVTMQIPWSPGGGLIHWQISQLVCMDALTTLAWQARPLNGLACEVTAMQKAGFTIVVKRT